MRDVDSVKLFERDGHIVESSERKRQVKVLCRIHVRSDVTVRQFEYQALNLAERIGWIGLDRKTINGMHHAVQSLAIAFLTNVFFEKVRTGQRANGLNVVHLPKSAGIIHRLEKCFAAGFILNDVAGREVTACVGGLRNELFDSRPCSIKRHPFEQISRSHNAVLLATIKFVGGQSVELNRFPSPEPFYSEMIESPSRASFADELLAQPRQPQRAHSDRQVGKKSDSELATIISFISFAG